MRDPKVHALPLTPRVVSSTLLRPLEPLPLQEQECVLLQVIRQSAVQETAGILQGLNPDVIRDVAEGDEFSVIT